MQKIFLSQSVFSYATHGTLVDRTMTARSFFLIVSAIVTGCYLAWPTSAVVAAQPSVSAAAPLPITAPATARKSDKRKANTQSLVQHDVASAQELRSLQGQVATLGLALAEANTELAALRQRLVSASSIVGLGPTDNLDQQMLSHRAMKERMEEEMVDAHAEQRRYAKQFSIEAANPTFTAEVTAGWSRLQAELQNTELGVLDVESVNCKQTICQIRFQHHAMPDDTIAHLIGSVLPNTAVVGLEISDTSGIARLVRGET